MRSAILFFSQSTNAIVKCVCGRETRDLKSPCYIQISPKPSRNFVMCARASFPTIKLPTIVWHTSPQGTFVRNSCLLKKALLGTDVLPSTFCKTTKTTLHVSRVDNTESPYYIQIIPKLKGGYQRVCARPLHLLFHQNTRYLRPCAVEHPRASSKTTRHRYVLRLARLYITCLWSEPKAPVALLMISWSGHNRNLRVLLWCWTGATQNPASGLWWVLERDWILIFVLVQDDVNRVLDVVAWLSLSSSLPSSPSKEI